MACRRLYGQALDDGIRNSASFFKKKLVELKLKKDGCLKAVRPQALKDVVFRVELIRHSNHASPDVQSFQGSREAGDTTPSHIHNIKRASG